MFRRILSINKAIPNAAVSRYLGTSTFLRAAAPTTTSNAAVSFDLSTVPEERKKLEELMKEDLPKPYEGPERDLVNFPRLPRPIYAGKVRLGFLPDEWFQFFYKKTGVTGPYVFGTGLITFLVSKEWYVIEDEFSTGCAIFLLIYAAVKKFGPTVKEMMEKSLEEEEAVVHKDKATAMKNLEESIEGERKSVWHAEGNKILMEAKRENVQMQLEAEYRRRMMHVYEQVKKRLDYQLEYYNTKRKLEQTHMVDWIVNNVVKSITPQQEKEALQKCIDDLKVLSAQAH